MSNSWIRGSRCGTDNCRTHYYKIIDGQRVCQYGHVYEGHYEYNDDDDADNIVVTRRITVPRASQGITNASKVYKGRKRAEKLFGIEARELFAKCFQYILRLQTKKVIKLCNLPPIFETTVKSFWLNYLNQSLSGNRGKKTFDDYNFKKLPSLKDSLGILYISCRHLQLPIYINDLVTWAINNEIPYMKAVNDLPLKWRSKLPYNFLFILDPQNVHVNSDLYLTVPTLAKHFQLDKGMDFNYEPLLLRLVNQFVLPPRIYKASKALISAYGIKFSIPNADNGTVYKKKLLKEFPEILLLSVVVLATKIYFLNLHDDENIQSYKIWLAIHESQHLSERENLIRHLRRLISSEKIDSELLSWDEAETSAYLSWFEKTMLLSDEEQNSVPMQRLYKMFSLASEKDAMNKEELELQEQECAIEITNLENSYKQLLKNTSKKLGHTEHPGISEQGLKDIENLFVDKLMFEYGVMETDLRDAFKGFEMTILKRENLEKVTQ